MALKTIRIKLKSIDQALDDAVSTMKAIDMTIDHDEIQK